MNDVMKCLWKGRHCAYLRRYYWAEHVNNADFGSKIII